MIRLKTLTFTTFKTYKEHEHEQEPFTFANMSCLPRTPIAKAPTSPRSKESHSKLAAMAKLEIKESDIAILIAAIQNSVGPVQVGAVLNFPDRRIMLF